MIRLRVFYSKLEHMRFTGHLDLYRTWERLIRRARLPLAYSQGFNPHPKLNLSPALPLGFTSACECIDIWLEQDIPPQDVFTQLLKAAPPGIRIADIQVIDPGEPAIQNQITAATYAITFVNPIPDLDQKIQQLLASESLPRVRRGKPYNLRPLIESLTIDEDQHFARLVTRLACREGATGRPEEVLAELECPPHLARIHRLEFTWLPLNSAKEPKPDSLQTA
jgi:radical SAM-linked protein